VAGIDSNTARRSHKKRAGVGPRFDDKSPEHDFPNVPARMPDEEGRSGIGNEWQCPVR